jgi:hypothetical protein
MQQKMPIIIFDTCAIRQIVVKDTTWHDNQIVNYIYMII